MIYSGSSISALNNTSTMTAAEIAAILTANNRDVMITSIPIGVGESTGRTSYLDSEKKWALSGDEFVPTDEHWIWTDSGKYTILELPWEDNGFRFDNIQHSPVNNYTFTQNAENNVVLRVTNVWKETGSLKVQKTVTGPNFDPDRKFTFTIELKDGRYPVYGTYSYTGTNIRNGSLTFDDAGHAVIQLKHNQAIEFTGIPAGYTYTITEANDDWYTNTYNDNTTGTIVADTTLTSSFTNTRKSSTLNVKKMVVGNMGDKSKLFDFEVYIIDEGREISGSYPITIHRAGGTNETVTDEFVEGAVVLHLSHGDIAEISGLPYGARYEVDELAPSRNGYKVDATNDNGTLGDRAVMSEWTNTKDGMVPTLQDFWMPDIRFVIAFVLFVLMFFGLTRKRGSERISSSVKEKLE